MTDDEPEPRRRIAEEAEENKGAPSQKRHEASEDADIKQVISSVERLFQELHRSNDEKGPKNKGERRWHIAEVLGLWAAALVGIIAVCVASHDASEQRGVMEGQLNIMQSQLRPFVGINEVRIEKAHVFGLDGWLITPVLKNSGNTQTRLLRRIAIESCLGAGTIMGGTISDCSGMERRETGPVDPEDTFQNPITKIRSVPVLPQATIPAGSGFLNASRIKQIADSGVPGYLYGVIHYYDGFDNKSEHITKYCFEFDGAVTITDAEQKPIFGFCPHWNCTDEECEADRKDYESEYAVLPNGKEMLEIQRGWTKNKIKKLDEPKQ